MRGTAIGNAEFIRSAHNKFAQPQNVVFDQSASKHGNAFHFVGFVPIDGIVYEIDGLKNNPRPLGEYNLSSATDWLNKAFSSIKEFISLFSNDEIHFSLLLLKKSRKAVIEEVFP